LGECGIDGTSKSLRRTLPALPRSALADTHPHL
jgi:hypothetical protein